MTAHWEVPNRLLAEETAHLASEINKKVKSLQPPPQVADALGSLSADLADLWESEKALASALEGFLKASPEDWEQIGGYLTEVKMELQHVQWHRKSVRGPLQKLITHVYSRDGKQKRP
ncbi:MAG: hypothetical protein HY686_04455 [Chloroflexi bacterium]|nr:hypothetical protein [Chloroflexota bacterium]